MWLWWAGSYFTLYRDSWGVGDVGRKLLAYSEVYQLVSQDYRPPKVGAVLTIFAFFPVTGKIWPFSGRFCILFRARTR